MKMKGENLFQAGRNQFATFGRLRTVWPFVGEAIAVVGFPFSPFSGQKTSVFIGF